jgi:hypothetical protein
VTPLVLLRLDGSTDFVSNALINEVAAYAKDICEEQGAPNCVKYVGYIQRGINLIFIAIGFAHGAVGESSSNEQSSFQPGTVRRDLGPGFNNFTQNLGSALQESGFSYDVLDSITVPGLNFGKRDVEPSIVSRLIARNMKANNSSSVYDVAFNYYDNGDLNLHLAGDFETLPWAEEYKSVAQKRFNGAGFKIAVTTRKKSLLTRAHQNEMANHIAADWAVASYREHAGDYFGLVKTDHTANFYFRIIPEVRGFGLGYESINTCGGMASFL